MKCNILKAQVEAAFRVGTQLENQTTACMGMLGTESRSTLLQTPQAVKEETSFVNPSKTSSLQDPNVRSPAPVRPETTPSTGPTEKQEIKVSRVRKLTRQYSFDEDDLPPALAAAAAASTSVSSASPGSQKTCTPQTSEGQTQVSPGGKSSTDAGSTFALEPGDLLMDFTEATPMIKTFPADTSNPFFDPFTTVPQFSAEFTDSKLQCCVVQSSPKLSPVAKSPVLRSLAETIPTPTVQTIYTSHKPISLADSAETLRRELEREKMMKRLLMTEL
ncbi:band 4.1-like protein 4B [Anas platyrhynchos]|nr:band 4.1-like protein 4B isoform X1 [Anas platyrhynchos]|eukprot:XP_021131681.1 band 4.1-like protein 4B isoform X1 [Anas platyrhynchos]